MKLERYKSIRNKPKRNSPISKTKSKMLAKAKDWTPNATPKLCHIYATKTEWASKVIPKAKE
jgi:hypothetical protein